MVCSDGEPSLHEVVTHLSLMASCLERELQEDNEVVKNLKKLCYYVSTSQDRGYLQNDFAEVASQLVTCMRVSAASTER